MLAISWPIESPLVTKDEIRLTLNNSYFFEVRELFLVP